MSFDTFSLSSSLMKAIKNKGYITPTPIQEAAIPIVLQGKDLMARAQTGTGKTAGFTLPMLDHLIRTTHSKKGRQVRALILTPTRELANQVHESVQLYGKYTNLKSAAIFGGVRIGPQISKLRRGIDVLVATPGRLLDHVNQKTVDLSAVEILVLDEADHMLDMGFIHDVRKIISLLPDKKQSLLFSATFSTQIRNLADGLLKDPQIVFIDSEKPAAETVQQHAYRVDTKRKPELLFQCLEKHNLEQVLVFTRTKHQANCLSGKLEEKGFTTAAIHGNKTQGARSKALSDFKKGAVRILVATDIAARGLDIQQLPCVVNYDLPIVPEDYIHRIGRTGRAGNQGQAISLVSIDELKLLRGIERLLKNPIEKSVIEGFEPDPSIKAQPILRRRGGGGKKNFSGRKKPPQKSGFKFAKHKKRSFKRGKRA